MKDVGYTQEGNRLIEMNEMEYAQFSRLCMAVEGKPLPDFYRPREYSFQIGYQFASVFEVIRAYYEERFRLNELQNLLDEIKDSLNRPK